MGQKCTSFAMLFLTLAKSTAVKIACHGWKVNPSKENHYFPQSPSNQQTASLLYFLEKGAVKVYIGELGYAETQNSKFAEAKQIWNRLVPGWVTTWEPSHMPP